MRQNLVAMLADLFNMLEVHPVKSVKYPGTGEYQNTSFHYVPYCMLLRPLMGVCGHNIKDPLPTNITTQSEEA